MRFTKMHGLGNDYIFIDGFRDAVPGDLQAVARRISDRRFGVGGDGLIVVEDDASADFRMRIFNADGSLAEMCGNGLRCAFKYLRDRRRISGDRAAARTEAGILEISLRRPSTAVEIIRVDMGIPRLVAGTDLRADVSCEPLRLPIQVEDRRFEAVCVSLGNPHAVIFLDRDVGSYPVHRYGPLIERHPWFPNRINVEFVQCKGKNELILRTWERGSGETFACGTGACASVVAGNLTGRVASSATVHLKGGDLYVEWEGEGRPVILEGPAEEVFSGEWNG